MNLYQPNLVLIRNEDNQLFLHATTFCDKIHYRSDGFEVATEVADGILHVKLFVLEDTALIPKYYYLEEVPESLRFSIVNSIVHIVPVGTATDEDLQEDGSLTFSIEADIIFRTTEAPNTRSGGKNKARTLSAGGRGRPGLNKK